MRVIAGKAKSLKLKTIAGLETRPTQDRIKETLFNMIQNDIYDCVFLDLYSGSGGIGIEALSRGAHKVVFVENNLQAVQCIKDNLSFTKLSDGGFVYQCDVNTALVKLESMAEQFDYIYMDPPYNKDYEKAVLTYLSKSNLVHDKTTIIIEASKETKFDYLKEINMNIIKTKNYKTNMHVFIERR